MISTLLRRASVRLRPSSSSAAAAAALRRRSFSSSATPPPSASTSTLSPALLRRYQENQRILLASGATVLTLATYMVLADQPAEVRAGRIRAEHDGDETT